MRKWREITDKNSSSTLFMIVERICQDDKIAMTDLTFGKLLTSLSHYLGYSTYWKFTKHSYICMCKYMSTYSYKHHPTTKCAYEYT